jgi:hypothetical protein
MPARGLLISWATTAASLPSEAIFSTTTIRWWVCSSCRVFSSTRCSSVRFSPRAPPGPAAGRRHLVPGAGQIAHLVGGAHRDPDREVAVAGPLHGHPQPLHGRITMPTARRNERRSTAATAAASPAVISRSEASRALVDPRHRELDVQDAEHPLRGGVDVALGAGGLVVHGGDDAEDAAPVRAAEDPHAVGALEARLRLGAGVAGDALLGLDVDDDPLLVVAGGGLDPALLVVDADPDDALLGPDVLDDPVDALSVVAEHPVVGGAADGLRDPVGGEADQPLELRSLAVEAEPFGRPEDQGGSQAEPETHAHGEAPPGSEAPRDGGCGP